MQRSRQMLLLASVICGMLLLIPPQHRETLLLGADESPLKIVTLGDSITKGYRDGVKMEETFSACLEKELHDLGWKVTVVNKGIGGERTDQGLKRLTKDVLDLKPDVVTIMYGANDSYVDKGKTESRITREEFGENLRTLVKSIRDAGGIPVLMTSTPAGKDHGPTGEGKHPNIRLSAFMLECREVADELNVPLIDHYAEWMQMEQDGVDFGKTLMTDQVHPNPEGHLLMAKSMVSTIEVALKQAMKK